MAKLRSFRLAAIAALLALVTLPAVAGFWNNSWPIVGGASYCAGSSTAGVPGTTPVCNVTVPAGPTVLTGTELIPADTALASGRQPQSVLISMAALGTLPYQYVVATNASSTTVAATTGKLVLDPAGTLTTATVVLPAATALVDGQQLELSSSQTLTALTVTPGSGTTISNAPTALTISTTAAYGYKFIYVAAATKWYRLQ